MAFSPDEYTGKGFGKYEVLCRLAVGGMAEIFLGFSRSGPFNFTPLVLKRLLSDQRDDPTAMRLLIDEARNTATLNHPNVARVLDLEVTQDDVLLVIQFINGANLEELIKAALEKKELLPVGFVLAAMRDAAQGLHHAHSHTDTSGKPRPIVHRDVTPRNIMVGFDGKGRVLDFGIARKLGAESRTMAGMVRGTTAYMSPEQAIGNPPDHRSDLFALGTIFHELLVGRRLFSRENPSKEMAAVYEAPIPFPSVGNPRVPKAIDAVVMKLLERPVNQRYQSATDFVRDLTQAAGSTLWTPEHSGQFVRDLFAVRRKQVDLLLDRVAVAAGMSDEKTGTGVIDDDEPRTMIERPGLAGTQIDRPSLRASANKATARTTEGLGRIETGTNPGLERPPLDAATDPGRVGAPTDPNRDADDLPTHFFKPRFEGGPGETFDTANDPEATSTGVSDDGPRSRSLLLVIGGVVAMLVGAFGGAFLYRSIQAPGATGPSAVRPNDPNAPGVGRVSITSDRPAEVQIGKQFLGRTPVVDVYLPSGETLLRLREPNGPWREAKVQVKKETMNKFELKLDVLPMATSP
jgi:serine/threonine protein kinase